MSIFIVIRKDYPKSLFIGSAESERALREAYGLGDNADSVNEIPETLLKAVQLSELCLVIF